MKYQYYCQKMKRKEKIVEKQKFKCVGKGNCFRNVRIIRIQEFILKV